MKLVFISSGQYPNGGAATNRHLAYSKGLIELGHDVEFILLSKQQWQEQVLHVSGIKFTCVKIVAPDNSSKINKITSHFRTLKRAKNLLNEINKVKKISALILLDTGIFVLIPLINFSKKIGVNVFHERTEYPFVVGGKSTWGKIDLNIYLYYVVKKFNGIYVINNALKKYFSRLTRAEIGIVNMIVDPSRFEGIPDKPFNEKKYITYCGTLDDKKDGVDILIRSFALIANDFPNITLELIASLDNKLAKLKMDSLIKELKIENRVLFTGFIVRDNIPKFLKKADILVLARPNNKQAEGGFPTKLGEYLASGVPVVVTNVGEISLFLKDRVNAFIAEPDSIEKFSEKLREVLLNENSEQVGREGRKLTYQEFNYLSQAGKIEKLISNNIIIQS